MQRSKYSNSVDLFNNPITVFWLTVKNRRILSYVFKYILDLGFLGSSLKNPFLKVEMSSSCNP